jgi:hypothetical protein
MEPMRDAQKHGTPRCGTQNKVHTEGKQQTNSRGEFARRIHTVGDRQLLKVQQGAQR